MQTEQEAKELYLLAERVCDEVFGEGEYEKLNGFSPRKGEFPEAPRQRRGSLRKLNCFNCHQRVPSEELGHVIYGGYEMLVCEDCKEELTAKGATEGSTQ